MHHPCARHFLGLELADFFWPLGLPPAGRVLEFRAMASKRTGGAQPPESEADRKRRLLQKAAAIRGLSQAQLKRPSERETIPRAAHTGGSSVVS